jgi:hypothetical protein
MRGEQLGVCKAHSISGALNSNDLVLGVTILICWSVVCHSGGVSGI